MSTNFLGLRHKYYAITITVSDDNTQSVIERNYNMEEILKQIALENRTTVGSVKKEIEFAIHEAMNYNMEEVLLIVVLLALAFLQSTRAARHTLLIMQNKRVFI